MAEEDDKQDDKPAEKPVVKPGDPAGIWVDRSHWEGLGDSGERWVEDGRWEANPDVNYGAPPGEGWTPMVNPMTGVFNGWQNTNKQNDVGWATMYYDDQGNLSPESMPVRSKGQYGYGSKGKQKRLRIFTYLVKGFLGAAFGYGAGAAAGLWGAGGAGGLGGAGGAAGEGALAGVGGEAAAGGEAALGGLGGVEPISTSGFTAGQGGIGSLGSGWGNAGVVAGEGGAGAAGTAAPSASSAMTWKDYADMGMRAKNALGDGQQQQSPSVGVGQSTIEQYQLPEQDIDERATAMRRATELRSRIAMLRARLEEGA
jgi:hypothetical protein